MSSNDQIVFVNKLIILLQVHVCLRCLNTVFLPFLNNYVFGKKVSELSSLYSNCAECAFKDRFGITVYVCEV